MRMLMVVVVALVLSGSAVMAGSGCCGMSKAPATCSLSTKTDCSEAWKDMNLSDEQKAKLSEAKAECEKSGYSEEARQKCMKVMESVLTPEQFEQCKASCIQKGVSRCPMTDKSEAPAEKAE